MSRRGGKTHQRVVEACATIALAVSQTQSGAAHTVQLMLRNPEFRETAIRDAQRRTSLLSLDHPTELEIATASDVGDAARVLLPLSGRSI